MASTMVTPRTTEKTVMASCILASPRLNKMNGSSRFTLLAEQQEPRSENTGHYQNAFPMNGSMLPQYITPTHKNIAPTAASLESAGASRPGAMAHVRSKVK